MMQGMYVLWRHVPTLPLFRYKYGSFHMAQFMTYLLFIVGSFSPLRAASVHVHRFIGKYIKVCVSVEEVGDPNSWPTFHMMDRDGFNGRNAHYTITDITVWIFIKNECN